MKVLCDNERQKPTFPPFVQQKSAFTLCEPSDKLYICKIPHLSPRLSCERGCGKRVAAVPQCPGRRTISPTELNALPFVAREPRPLTPSTACAGQSASLRARRIEHSPSPHIEQAHEVSPNSTMYADCRHEHDRLCRPGFCSCPHACRPRPSRRRQRHQRSCGRCHRSGSFRRDHQSERPKRRLLFRRKRRI